MYSCGILTVSDSSFFNHNEDVSGNILFEELSALVKFKPILRALVPDDTEYIQACLIKWSDNDKINLILTTGGTGMTPRDVTPEATKSILERDAASISQAMLIESLKVTKFAMLSRGVCGIRRSTLIINLPGSPKAVKECLSYLASVLEHALDQLTGKHGIVKAFHAQMLCPIKTAVSTLPVDIMNRPRSSSFPLFSVPIAKQIVLSKTDRLQPVMLKIEDSSSMVTSDKICSLKNVPPFPASIKDGYAVLFSDGAGAREVVSISNAGDNVSTDCALKGKCARISTGAEVPKGYDSVVQIEDTDLLEEPANIDREMQINIRIGPEKMGQDIRPLGNDLKVGEGLISEGVVMGPCEIGLLAMGGLTRISCYRRPVVGVLSTGNELVSNGDESQETRIIDCNRPLLISLFRGHNCEVLDLGIVMDEPQFILETLHSALKTCDIIVTTGGVSMGEKDYLKDVLTKDLGAEIHFGRIFMKPGKPTTFSTICNKNTGNSMKLIFSLPGNPVSSFVTAYLFVLPALRKMAGHKNCENETIQATLIHDVNLDDRPDYRRCSIRVVEGECGNFIYQVSSTEFGNQMSSRLLSCVSANGLLCLPPKTEGNVKIQKGSIVSVLKF